MVKLCKGIKPSSTSWQTTRPVFVTSREPKARQMYSPGRKSGVMSRVDRSRLQPTASSSVRETHTKIDYFINFRSAARACSTSGSFVCDDSKNDRNSWYSFNAASRFPLRSYVCAR